MAIKFETVTGAPSKPVEKPSALAAAPQQSEPAKASAKKIKSRNTLKKK